MSASLSSGLLGALLQGSQAIQSLPAKANTLLYKRLTSFGLAALSLRPGKCPDRSLNKRKLALTAVTLVGYKAFKGAHQLRAVVLQERLRRGKSH